MAYRHDQSLGDLGLISRSFSGQGMEHYHFCDAFKAKAWKLYTFLRFDDLLTWLNLSSWSWQISWSQWGQVWVKNEKLSLSSCVFYARALNLQILSEFDDLGLDDLVSLSCTERQWMQQGFKASLSVHSKDCKGRFFLQSNLTALSVIKRQSLIQLSVMWVQKKKLCKCCFVVLSATCLLLVTGAFTISAG